MRHVFITGATGVIGASLIPLFLKDENTYLYLLIRADSTNHLQKKMDDLLDFCNVESTDQNTRSRVQPLMGDVTLPNFGLEANLYGSLSSKITHIIHSAANVKMNLAINEARNISVFSAQEIITFAHACNSAGCLKKLDVISTVGIAGKLSGLIPENRITTSRTFHNTYEQAKAEAEQLFFSAQDQGLPITLHRPSMVVGDSKTGVIRHRQIFYHLCQFFSGKITYGIVPRFKNVYLDLIPVDYVAEAIYLSSNNADAKGKIFHLCSGEQNAIDLNDFVKAIRHIYKDRGCVLFPLIWIDTDFYKLFLQILSIFADEKRRRTLNNLSLYFTYATDHQTFDNQFTNKFFAPLKLMVPSIKDYLQRVVV